MDSIPDRTHPQDGDMIGDKGGGNTPTTSKGGGKPRPYPIRCRSQHKHRTYRVGAGLAPALAPSRLASIFVRCRPVPALVPSRLAPILAYLLLISFFLSSSVALLLVSSSQKALALGNTFIVTMLGSSQQPGFAPDLLTVHIYDTVVFMNASAASIAITATDSSFSSPAIAPGKQWKVTFNSMGAFEYHDTGTPSPHIFGEIVVVPDTVALLPSPAPAAQETAIAYIQASKTPPDTVWQQATPSLQTPIAVSPSQNRTTRTLSVPPLALLLSFVRPIILVIIVLCALFVAGLGGLWFYRRTPHKKEDDDDEDDSDE